MEQTKPFIEVGSLSEFPPGSKRVVQVGDKPVCVVSLEGKIVAFDDYCPHRAGPLSEGEFTLRTVTCPWHTACFDLHTGEVVSGPARRGLFLREVRSRDGRLEIR